MNNFQRPLHAAEAHEDGGSGEDEADEDAPAPEEEDPAFLQQAPQEEISPQKGIRKPGEPPDQHEQKQTIG